MNRRAIVTEEIKKIATFLDETDAKNMEIGIYNWAINYAKKNDITRAWTDSHFENCYLHHAMHILANLQKNSYVKNTRLLERLENNEFKPEELPNIKNVRLFPEVWRAEIEAVALRQEKALKPKMVPKTDRYTCGKCKKNDCSFYEMQIRSGDEGSTIFIYCINCGHSWRVN